MEESEEEECGLGAERNMIPNKRTNLWGKRSSVVGGGGARVEKMHLAIKPGRGAL